ncbi:MAG: zinc ribbon domain-containing protein [Anaeromyxobacter sp.]
MLDAGALCGDGARPASRTIRFGRRRSADDLLRRAERNVRVRIHDERVSASAKPTRGPNRQRPWSRRPEDGLSVLRLALDIHDPVQRRRLEGIFSGAYQLRRALQRTARDRVRAYWAAGDARARSASETRTRLGLTREALEQTAYAHLDAAPHLRRNVTKALAMHLADSVWTSVERHLFPDATGKRHGLLHVGRWFDFTRLPGRARSHTRERKWETFRLHGSLAGHRARYTRPDGSFVQPRRLQLPEAAAPRTDWWAYQGPLALVFSGLAGGALVLPVRLPTAPCNQPILDHHLVDPARWHKVDLVRTRAPYAPGGWRYEAHLMVLAQPYVSPSTQARREAAAKDEAERMAGIDVNVSNLTVVSQMAGAGLRLTKMELDGQAKVRDRGRKRRERRRQRALERSRRAANRAEYQLSRRQEKRARRRAAAGLPPVEVIPGGPRLARFDGVPLQAHRRDSLSKRYRLLRAAQAADAASCGQARRGRARQSAAEVVRTHGYRLFVEDVAISVWARRWGRGVAAFTPGTLVAAIDREARAVAAFAGGVGGVVRIPTQTTALSQHCPCGARVEKSLAERVHRCPRCGLEGDRDAVSAVLGAFLVLNRPGEPGSARVDYDATKRAREQIGSLLRSPCCLGRQDARSESTDLFAREPSFAWRTSTPASKPVARRIVGTATGPTRDEAGESQTTPERARWRTDLAHALPLGEPWDIS